MTMAMRWIACWTPMERSSKCHAIVGQQTAGRDYSKCYSFLHRRSCMLYFFCKTRGGWICLFETWVANALFNRLDDCSIHIGLKWQQRDTVIFCAKSRQSYRYCFLARNSLYNFLVGIGMYMVHFIFRSV